MANLVIPFSKIEVWERKLSGDLIMIHTQLPSALIGTTHSPIITFPISRNQWVDYVDNLNMHIHGIDWELNVKRFREETRT